MYVKHKSYLQNLLLHIKYPPSSLYIVNMCFKKDFQRHI